MIDQEQLAVSPTRFVRTLREGLADCRVDDLREYGPAGLSVVLHGPIGRRPIGSVIVSQADHDGVEWLHASIAFEHEDPAYADLVTLKAAVFGSGREAYQVFPAASRHVNIHSHALHLWGRADGRAVLPDLTQGSGSI